MNIEGNYYNKMIKGEERQGFPFVLSSNKIKSSQKRVIYILYISIYIILKLIWQLFQERKEKTMNLYRFS